MGLMRVGQGSYVAAERKESGKFVRHPDSPEFTDARSVMDWLELRGLIKRVGQPHEDLGYAGWGSPWFAVPTDKAEAA